MSRDLFCPTGRIYRGNLHGHCTHSDGRNEAAEVVRLYREAGYDFTCLSDHYWTDPRYSAETVCDSSGLDSDDFITIIWAFTDMSVAGRAGITYITLMRPSFPCLLYTSPSPRDV